MEKTLKTNGFKLRSWGDVAAVSTVTSVFLALFIGVLLWGLKLEGELNVEREINRTQGEKIAEIEATIAQGILNVAKTEIENLRRRIDRHEDEDGH